jgi:hypothetical protein
LQGEKGVLLEIRLEQLAGALVELWLGAGSILGRQLSALPCEFGVALDGGEANGEGAGGLALAHPSLESFDDLLS